MLLPWSKPTRVLIAPEGLAICHAKSSNVEILSNHTVPCNWDTLLQELVNMAPQLELGHVRFVISHSFVRQAVLPWQAGVFSRQDWQGLGEHHFRKTFGAISDTWQVRVAMQGYGNSAVSCAVDQALIGQLEQVAKQFNFTISCIEPVLMTVFNRYQRQIDGCDWLLVAEPHHLLLAEFEAGKWKNFSISTPPVEQAQEECINMLLRAVHLSEKVKGDKLVYFGAPDLIAQNRLQGFKIVALAQSFYKNSASVLVNGK